MRGSFSACLVLGLFSITPAFSAPPHSKPNIVIVLADDLGYGDLAIQGHPLIRTPNIDRLAREGQRWTSFYASAPLCGPSRVALMTGRLPIRMSGTGKNEWLQFPIPKAEVTLGEMLKKEGYATGYIGKWGIAGSPDFSAPYSHPNDRGFDDFFGLNGSNDAPMKEGLARTYDNIKHATSDDFPIALYRQRNIIEQPAYQPTLTQRYTEEAVRWIKDHRRRPFLLFVAHSMPHVPLFRSKAYEGHSKAGLYGDVIEELDASVGEVIKTLKDTGLASNTLVIFTSDNGPWLTYFDMGGSPGPLRDGKITSWEGGFRVPGIFWWPGTIKPAVVDDIAVNVDLMKTLATLTGAKMPNDRPSDSMDLSSSLLRGSPSPRKEWFFYGTTGNLWAARVGNYKLVYESFDSVGPDNLSADVTRETLKLSDRGYGNHVVHDPPLLFDLSTDISERRNVASEYPDVVASIQKQVDSHRQALKAEHQ